MTDHTAIEGDGNNVEERIRNSVIRDRSRSTLSFKKRSDV